MGEDRSGLLPSCCGKYERGFRCGACPEDDALVDSMVGNPAQRVRLMARLAALRARAERAEGALVEIRAEMPETCTCDAAYSGRHLADPSCGYHDYGAVCLEIIDHALAARGE